MKKTFTLIPLLICSICSCASFQIEKNIELKEDDLIGSLKTIFENHNYSVLVGEKPFLAYELDGNKFHMGRVDGEIPAVGDNQIYLYSREYYLCLNKKGAVETYTVGVVTDEEVIYDFPPAFNAKAMFEGTFDYSLYDFYTRIINGSMTYIKEDNHYICKEVTTLNEDMDIEITSSEMIVRCGDRFIQTFYNIGKTTIEIPEAVK